MSRILVFAPFLVLASFSHAKSQPCVPAPAGLVGWWAGDGNGDDIVGTLGLTLSDGATFAPAKVGEGFAFYVAGAFAQNIEPALTQVDNWTMDSWVIWDGLRSGQQFQSIFYNGHGGSNGYGLLVSAGTGRIPGVASELVVIYGGRAFYPTGVLLPLGTSHLAVARGGGVLHLYLNGAAVFEQATAEPYTPGPAIGIGQPGGTSISRELNPAGDPTLVDISFNGLVDEFDVFSRALASTEIEAIFDAGSAGKCKDSDNDGVPDDDDSCPESDSSDTIIVDGVDTGVKNELQGDGCTLSDLIAETLGTDPSLEDTVVVLVDLRSDGLISGRELGSILKALADGANP